MSNHELQTIYVAFRRGQFATDYVYRVIEILDDPATEKKEINVALRCVRLFGARGNNAPSNLRRRAADVLAEHDRRLAALRFCLAKKR